MPITCPVCGKDDYIGKVSAIVESGTSIGTHVSSFSGISDVTGKTVDGVKFRGEADTYSEGVTTTMQQSNLASKLALPPEPSLYYPPLESLGNILFLHVLNLCVHFIVCLCVAVFVDIIGGSVLLTNIILFGIPAALFCFNVYSDVNENKNLQEEFERQKALYEKQHPRWLQMHDTWCTLYYCQRDDIVFSRDTSKYIDANKMQALLKERL